MRRTIIRSTVVALFVLPGLVHSQATRPTPPPVTGPQQWIGEIEQFETADRRNPPPIGAVLFVGSSSIRMWTTLASDFPDTRVINRGFGGSEFSDVIFFADRIIIPYKPRLIVLYAGDNDLAAGKSPAQVFADYKTLVGLIHRRLPRTRIAFISIKPSIARVALTLEIRAANALVRRYDSNHPLLTYIDVFTPMLDSAGAPRKELFLDDGLHMNAKGYAIWKRALDPVLH